MSWTGSLSRNFGIDAKVEAASLGNAFEPGDVLFGKLRPYLAKVWVAEFSGRSSTECLVMQSAEVEPRFLAYACLARAFVEQVDASTHGAKMPRAEWESVRNISIPVPARHEQRKIVDFLDRETARLDALVAEKAHVIELLAEKRQAVVAQAVTRGIDPDASYRDSGVSWPNRVPTHWKLVSLRFLVDVIGGATPDTGRTEFWDGDTPWVSPKDMKQDAISDTEAHVSALGISESALQMIPKDAVLVVVRGMILAHSIPVAIARNPVTINQDMKALICHDDLDPLYLRDFLRASRNYLVAMIESAAHGTKRMESAVLGNLQVPLPTLSEQKEISRQISERTRRTDEIQAATTHAMDLLKERRAALIASAVAGRLSVERAA